jgi:hypothetical protein
MPPQQTAGNRWKAWIVAVLALAGYAAAATLILTLRRGSLTGPWWSPAVPPVVYAIVAVATVRSFSLSRLLKAIGVLCATHGLLLVGTVVVASVVAPDLQPPLSSAALGLLILVCVPLVLAPLRSLVQAPRGSSPRSKRTTAPSPAPSRTRAASPTPPVPQPAFRPVASPRSWPAPAARAPEPESGPQAGRTAMKPYAYAPPVASPSASPPAPPASPAKPEPIAPSAPPPVSSLPPAPALVSAAPSSRPTVRAAEPVAGMIRIPFARIADQLAAEVFTLPREQVGAQLREPDVLLVPERLIVPQLVEGLVQVDWAQVAEQFPRQALALSDDAIVQRLPSGTLVLPLDEVVRQVSPDVFALAAPTLEEGLEDFPLPFQPPEPSAPAAKLATESMPEPVVAEAVSVAAEAVDDAAPEPEPAAEQETDWTPEPVAAETTEEAEPEPEPAAEQETDWAPEPVAAETTEESVEPEPDDERQTEWISEPVAAESARDWAPEREPAGERQTDWTPEPVQEEAAQDWTPEPALAAEPVTDEGQEPPAPAEDPAPSSASRADDARRMAVLLGPLLSPVTVENFQRAGASFLTLAPPNISGATIADVAASVLPFLTDPRLPEPAVQATVRGTAMTVVITPLAGAPDMAFAAGTLPGASLALLERLCLKEAAVPMGDARPVVRTPAPSLGAELREAPAEPSVVAVAASLRTFGRVTASVLHDPDDPFVVYLFLPSGLEVRALGGFARNLHRALADSPAGAPASVLLRVGTRRVVVRPVQGVRRAVLVAGGGPLERPGMARLELERAAARLGKL